jgi:dimethylglycine dehydrogenase
MKSHARVVIVGGGVMGVGLLYHLALEGWTDTVLLEKGELTSGSTWHAAGQCPHFNSSLNMTKVHVYGTQLYPKLEALTGQAVSWHRCGGLRLACTDEEVNWLKHILGMSKLAAYEGYIIGPDEVEKVHPFLNTRGVRAAFLTIGDGHVAPADITHAMAAGARKLGADIARRTRVNNIKLLPTGEWLVVTDKGEIVCQHVVNSAGSYADLVGSWTGHRVPIANLLHHYVITEPVRELIEYGPELPVVRDPWSHAYLREETDGILVGPYETSTAHVCWDGRPPSWDFESELIAPELDRLAPFLERAAERLPLFGQVGIKNVIAGAITHTPDGIYLSGPAPGTRNYWMHCGASIGICQGAGAGRFLAQWIVHGQAEINMREFDPRRFGNWAAKEYTAAIAVADYHHMYYCYKPGEQHSIGRGLRKSSLHEVLEARGAQFSQVFGWERPRWYDHTGEGEKFSFKRSNWWSAVERECSAVRQRVGLMDLSTFTKIEIRGADAMTFLSRICANKLPQRDNGIVLAHILSNEGFIESEFTITRLSSDHFYVLSAAVAQLHDIDQLHWRLRGNEKVTISDVTDEYGVLVLAGPKSREVLACCTDVDLDNTAFRWLSGKKISIAGVHNVRALRLTYVGELGWELHVPMALLPEVFNALMTAGEHYNISVFGTYAMNSLRMEKAYRSWGSELTNEVTMIESDMERFLDLEREFTGKAATLRSIQRGPRIRLVYMSVDAGENDCYGNEPVYFESRLVGVTTGGAYGHAVKKSLAFAYIEPALAEASERFDILMMGEMREARILRQAAWDPSNARIKS